MEIYIDKIKSITEVSAPLYATVKSYGCLQNISDSEKIKGMLVAMGFTLSDTYADLVVFNTCAVRKNAENKALGNIGALKSHKETYPNAVIAVCGCFAQEKGAAKDLQDMFPFIDLVFGTDTLSSFPRLLAEVYFNNKKVIDTTCTNVITEDIPLSRDCTYKANVPIMYGCNNFCTYCIVPFVRGRERSRDANVVTAEVTELVKNGYKNLMLLGQNVNSYGKEQNTNFATLLSALDQIEGNYWLSFMTSHPKDCTNELLDVIATSTHISTHLHLPIQSGSNRILAAMNRGYTREAYIALAQAFREKIPTGTLTTDIIVGFPGETYADVMDTVSLLKEVQFDSAFIFIYSKRKGTKAYDMPETASKEEISCWFKEVLETQNAVAAHSYDKYVGQTLTVLCDGKSPTTGTLFRGFTRQNIIVEWADTIDRTGTFVDILITEALSWQLKGAIPK